MSDLATIIAAIGTVVTALATIVLVGATIVLAVETRRLAALTSRPLVNATLRTNRWAIGFADLFVENTGTGTAYDISIKFDPPIPFESIDKDGSFPFEKISLLQPGQRLSSYVAQFMEIIDDTYQVTISWKSSPDAKKRETLSYPIRVADIKGSGQLGGGDPTAKIATEIEKMSKTLHDIASGWKKPRVEITTSEDRAREREAHLEEAAKRRYKHKD